MKDYPNTVAFVIGIVSMTLAILFLTSVPKCKQDSQYTIATDQFGNEYKVTVSYEVCGSVKLDEATVEGQIKVPVQKPEGVRQI